MLRKNVRDRIRYEKMMRDKQDMYYALKKTKTGRERGRESRERKTALRDLQGLTFLLENWPEKQVEQVFNYETMKPFFNALLCLESDDKERRLKRVKLLWKLILFRDPTYAQNLVGKDTWNALVIPTDLQVKAIAYAAMFQ